MIDYLYSNGDLFENPQKYQKTPYYGKEFLLSYITSRQNILEIFEDSILISEIYSRHDYEHFDMNSAEFYLENFLVYLIMNFNSKVESDIDNFCNILLKKFEITKKLFLTYNNNLKEISTDFKYVRNYLLLSILIILMYDKTKNLKYLNTLFKINDSIITQISSFKNNDDGKILRFILEKEIFFVKELCKQKGVVL